MTAHFRLRAGCGPAARINPSVIERSLARYPAGQRPRVCALASRHPRLAELAVTFPGLLFALAARERGAGEAVELVVRGAHIVQLKGPGNVAVSKTVYLAARRWVDQHDLIALEQPASNSGGRLDRATWLALWRPYWIEKRRIPSWLPMVPCHVALRRLAYWGR